MPVAARMPSSSPVPTTASTSGMRLRISSRKRSTRQPATTSFFARPEVLSSAISRIVFTDSCCALSMNEQVFTTITSASSARGESSAPARASRPIITSLSTRFLGQPRLTKPTFCGRGAVCGLSGTAAEVFSSGRGIVRFFEGMQSDYFNIFRAALRPTARRTIVVPGASDLPGDYRHHERQYLWKKTLPFMLP